MNSLVKVESSDEQAKVLDGLDQAKFTNVNFFKHD